MSLNLAIIGPGLVGSEFISQVAKTPYIKLIAIANSTRMLLHQTGTSATTWKADLTASQTATDLKALIDHAAARQPCVVVDCTSSEAVATSYPEWLDKGLHVVTPNKKAFSGDLGLWKKITENKKSLVYHESTVGAGLPILSTLKDLVETGDEIVRIEGIFSGTLSYIFNNFSSTAGSSGQFSKTVTVAKELGYTEPDPRDDLNGMDVARKVVILGRVAGIDLDLSTLPVENIVPEALRGVPTADEFMSKLPTFDDHFEQLNQAALKENSVLRYVGLVDPNGNSSVKLMKYPASHPFASLKGSDNIIAFTTKRFPNPLIVQGAGAGAAVTAFGMFADVLKIARILGLAK
ncbi:homoserine dehydrogenase [Spizellomyces punctatus DAOM BR117]|uniref:Homoserine dehydrogenase n=1 Tax=Spizellomyces punctatus (strain DAOM BR117) TaxID=645134 RepID=A0A0L0HMD7_SPIPD|nr:homoserine dehydrogenase [Spizellomyces punctatus DAOM BR117]KND01989.1 hypothetical protein SPPG_02495 [Spizellomyces punctatus DAOM BR117]|eukprot:XP_016610028.1 hypothetical protein SPPG_02495 [Spizellomyces punctatus DAOM BR117]